MIEHDSIIREDIPAARFDFGRGAFVIPAATTDDELLPLIAEVADDVLDAYRAITRAMPEQLVKLADAHYREKVGAS